MAEIRYDSAGQQGYLNDLWKYDPTLGTTGEWIWVGGGNVVGRGGGLPGVHGTLGTPASTNIPGGRYGIPSWIEVSGNLWLFGGQGYDSGGEQG